MHTGFTVTYGLHEVPLQALHDRPCGAARFAGRIGNPVLTISKRLCPEYTSPNWYAQISWLHREIGQEVVGYKKIVVYYAYRMHGAVMVPVSHQKLPGCGLSAMICSWS